MKRFTKKESDNPNETEIYDRQTNISYKYEDEQFNEQIIELLNTLNKELRIFKKFNNCLIHIINQNNIKLDKYFFTEGKPIINKEHEEIECEPCYLNRYLVDSYGTTENKDIIYGIFDSQTKSPYWVYSLNNDKLKKITKIMNDLYNENNELKKTLSQIEEYLSNMKYDK